MPTFATAIRTGIALSITIDDENLVLPLNRFAARMTDFRRFWEDFYAPQFFGDVLENFRTQGGLVGGWRALSPRYAAWKRMIVGNKPILQFSGALKESFYRKRRDNVFRVSTLQAEFGSRVPYLKFHQQGTRRMPQRKVITVGPRRVYEPLLATFVAEEAASAGMPNVRYGGRRFR